MTTAAEKPTRAVVACMDYRVKESVILADMGWPEAYVIRNAGGVVTEDVIRSLFLLQKFVLDGTYDIEIVVVAHTDCGMVNAGEDDMRRKIESDSSICQTPPFALETIPSPALSVRRAVQRLRASSWVKSRTQAGLRIQGRLYDVKNATLSSVTTYAFQTGESWPDAVAKHENYTPTPTVESLRSANPQTAGAAHEGLGQVIYIPGQPG